MGISIDFQVLHFQSFRSIRGVACGAEYRLSEWEIYDLRTNVLTGRKWLKILLELSFFIRIWLCAIIGRESEYW